MRFSGFDEMLSWWAEHSPDKTALLFEADGVCRLSFSQLYSEVKMRASELERGGKTCIGILSDGSRDCVVTLFAAVIAGLQVVMLDENAPEDMLRALIAYTDIDLLWGDYELTEALSPYLTGGVKDGRGKILLFSSGTTERAKAVVLTDKSLCQSAYNGANKLPLSPDDVLLCMLPLGHVFGLVCGLLWGLSCGAAVALGRGARHYADDCAHFKPTAVSLVPLLLGFLFKQKLFNPELMLVLVGAGSCPSPLLEAVGKAGVRVCFGYGLTETSSGVAISVSGDPLAMEVCVDDTITLAPDGEILVSAPTCMMQGYYKRTEDTAAALQDGVLHTGDLGRFDENGRLYITGRKKELLVLPDGTKVFLPEYEAAVSSALGVTELAAILMNGGPALVIQGRSEQREDILLKLRPVMAQLPRGQQLRDIIFVDEPMPRTATGKIKRWELQQKLEMKK